MAGSRGRFARASGKPSFEEFESTPEYNDHFGDYSGAGRRYIQKQYEAGKIGYSRLEGVTGDRRTISRINSRALRLENGMTAG